MSAFSVENPHDGKMFENYTRFEWGVEVGVVTIFMLRLFVPREFDMIPCQNGKDAAIKSLNWGERRKNFIPNIQCQLRTLRKTKMIKG